MTRAKVFFMLLVFLCLASAAAGQTVLYDFYADWCRPCQAMTPTVDGLLQAGYCVERINIDQNEPLAAKYGVQRIPCFVMVEEGRETDRVVGPASYSRLEAMFSTAVRRQPAESPASSVGLGAPHPAWRYEQAVGYRSAVVRIFAEDDARTRSIGSGTLVKWKDRLVILTARHVVQDAKKIVVWFSTGKTHTARVLSADATWDVAVLGIDATPEGVEPVELELGAEAMQQQGSRLESCGYGPDGKLACNSGLFVGYRRSTAAPRGPDDWMIVSGCARSGDSGGPVFNQRGRMVGVLWGTDGKEIVCVQAGRLHVLLDEAVSKRQFQQRALVPVVSTRTPTPAHDAEPPVPIESLPCCSEPAVIQASFGVPGRNVDQECLPLLFGRKPTPAPQPSVIVQPDPEVRRSLGSIDSKLEVLVQPKLQTKPAEEEAGELSPLLAGLCILAAVVVGCVIYFATTSKQ